MAMTAASTEGSAATSPAGTAALFHALSEPSTVSQHLTCLRDCGLVTSRAQGRSSHYSLPDPTRVRALLTEAGRLLAATGGAAAAHDERH
jgi:DNA-binding transcriptional ArsR family regulator